MRTSTVFAALLAMVGTLALTSDASARKPTPRIRTCPVNRSISYRQRCRCPSGTKMVRKSRSTRVCQGTVRRIRTTEGTETPVTLRPIRPAVLNPGMVGEAAAIPGTVRPSTTRPGTVRPNASRSTGFRFIDELLRTGKTNICVVQPKTLPDLIQKLYNEALKLKEGPCGPQMAALMAIINELMAKYGSSAPKMLMMGSRGQCDGDF